MGRFFNCSSCSVDLIYCWIFGPKSDPISPKFFSLNWLQQLSRSIFQIPLILLTKRLKIFVIIWTFPSLKNYYFCHFHSLHKQRQWSAARPGFRCPPAPRHYCYRPLPKSNFKKWSNKNIYLCLVNWVLLFSFCSYVKKNIESSW